MKKLILIVGLIISFSIVCAQEGQEKPKQYPKLPAVDIKTLNGTTFNTADIKNDGKPIIISLWATWCKPCVAELLAIADVYAGWQAEPGVTF